MIYIRFKETQVQYLYLITRLIFWLSEGLSSTKLRHKFRAFYTYNIVYGQLYSTTLKLKVCFEVVHININVYSQHLFSSSCTKGTFRTFVVQKGFIYIIILTAGDLEMACLSIQRKQFKPHWTGKCQRNPGSNRIWCIE